jgi:hypothetical protein
MKWLLRLYPPAWQRRYRREVESYLDAESRKIRTALDLIAGAIDAWLNPNWIPERKEQGSERTMITASRCGPVEISRAEAIRSGIWMLGVTFVLTATYVVLSKSLGPHITVEALLYSAFFIAFMVSSRYTYLKPYSRIARNVIVGLSVPGWYLFFLGALTLSAGL